MFIFLDTETSGIEEDNNFLCQLAYKCGDKVVNELFKPQKEIEVGAMAVHHITNKMVADKPVFKDSAIKKELVKLLDDYILVAHNAKFDVKVLEREGIKVPKYICTMKLAQYLDKEAVIPQYKMQYLRYLLGIEIEATAHDAYGDILVLEKLFDRLITKVKKEFENDEVNEMIKISMNPLLLKKIMFGKHRGQKFENIPSDYLQWLTTTDLDEDMKFTVNHYLGRV